MVGDRMSGWRVECPACGEAYLLPSALAEPGRRVLCPGCRAVFPAADPAVVAAWVPMLEAWARTDAGGPAELRAARDEGRFWREHGESLLRVYDSQAGGARNGAAAAAAFRAALARVLGPGREIF